MSATMVVRTRSFILEEGSIFVHGSSKGCVTYMYLLFFTLISSAVLRADQSACGNICPVNNPSVGWSISCLMTGTGCLNIHEVIVPATVPAAPTNLQVVDTIVTDKSTNVTVLGLNITWQLPRGNVSGLTGFVIRLEKMSYPVGQEYCHTIAVEGEFTHDNYREVKFQFTCWHSVNIDGKYSVRVTSLNSGQSVTNVHRTLSCFELQGVGYCENDIEKKNNWTPPDPPSVQVTWNNVTVTFYTYPGDFWLTYLVNLFDRDKNATPLNLSKFVPAEGKRLRLETTFQNVPLGHYIAKVLISPLEASFPISSRSLPFQVTQQPPSHLPHSSSSPLPYQPTSMAGSLPVTEGALREPYVPDTFDNKTFKTVGIVVGIAVAVLLVSIVLWKRLKPNVPAVNEATHIGEHHPHQNTDDASLVNNIVAENQYRCDDVSGISQWEECNCRHMVDHVYPDILEQDSYVPSSVISL